MSKRTKGALAPAVCGCAFDRRKWLIGMAAVTPLFFAATQVNAAVLLNDSFTDGDRTNTNLPTDSPVYVGVNGTDGGTFTVAPGALKNVMGTSSRRNWTFWTNDNSAPNGSQ